MTNNQLGATLDATNLGKYDQLVQACLATGAYCMIDIHNFARWNGGIIGQGGPTDDQFVSLWTQLATKYATTDKIIFELMNEPHDLDIDLWAATCQKAVTAIRNAGAAGQTILLPGTNFDSAATLVSSGSAAALLNITNPDGSTAGLVLDVHKYLDTDNSGTHAECVTNNTDSFQVVADFLRSTGRQALVSETGASSDATCLTDFCAQNAFLNANADVFVGLVAWAAGSFGSGYLLSLTPTKSGNSLVDGTLASQCLVDTWLNSNGTASPPAVTMSTTAAPSQSTTSSTPASLTISGGGSGGGMESEVVGSSTMIVTLATATADEASVLLIATGTPPPVRASAVATLLTAPSPTPTRDGTASNVASSSIGAPSSAPPTTANGSDRLRVPVEGIILAGLLAVAGFTGSWYT